MSAETGVALVGYGYAARTFHAPLIDGVPGLALRVVVSRNPDEVRAERPHLRVVSRASDAFADPEVELVVVATPNDTHFALAAEALAAGKHVVVDKPFTLTVAEAEGLAGAARRAGRLLSVFQNRRWDADFLTLRRLLASETLGRVVHFESHFDRYRPLVLDRWRESAQLGAGLWFDLGPHLADQALQLFGAPEALYADFGVQRDGGRGVDYFHVLLRYGTLRAILHASTLAARPGPRFVLHGTRGSYVKDGLDVQETALKAGGSPRDADYGVDASLGEFVSGDGGEATRIANERGDYTRYYVAMRDAVRAGGENPVPPAQAIDVMRVIERGRESAERGVELPFSPSL